jgi:hypothetical protein
MTLTLVPLHQSLELLVLQQVFDAATVAAYWVTATAIAAARTLNERVMEESDCGGDVNGNDDDDNESVDSADGSGVSREEEDSIVGPLFTSRWSGPGLYLVGIDGIRFGTLRFHYELGAYHVVNYYRDT